MKTCNICTESKPLDEFYANRAAKDGKYSRCKACAKAHNAIYYAANRGKLLGSRTAKPHVLWEAGYRRRARKFGFEPVVVSFTLDEMIAYWGNGERCIYCDGPFQEMDHLIPVGLGGRHAIENCAPSCAPCNRANIRQVRAIRAAVFINA